MELHQSSSGGGTSDPSSGGGEPSCVSMKSNRSMDYPPGFSSGGGRPSCVSMKSDRSMDYPPAFSSGGREPSWVSMKSDRSMDYPPGFSSGGREPSCVSMKSDRSMDYPPGFSSGGREPSCVSMKSNRSMDYPPGFSSGGGRPSCVSMKSDRSMDYPPAFSSGGREPSWVSMKSDRSMDYPPGFSSGGREPSCVSMKSDRSMDYPPGFSSGGREPSCVSMKSDRSMDYPPGFSNGGGRPSYASAKSNSSGAAPSDSEKSSREAAPHTHTLLGGTGPPLQDSHQSVDDVLHRVIKKHKSSMKKKYKSLFEGIKTEENKTLLNRIYTQLYIIEGESEGVNEEHEVLQMEKTPRRHREDTPINCSDIFKPLLGHKVPDLRSVLTKGIAGIGKTVSVQKFILDWAEGTANQDVDFMFVLSFRELNLIKDHQYSLHGLLCDFHPELKDLDPKIYEKIKAVLIFDGLDESRIPLNFEECEKVSDITMTSSVGVLMTNLIKGDLLPSALIWITCRPAAAKQIPPKHINCVTEIQGFSDPQKEEYFRKRISDQDQAQKIISHIKTARSLHIMCRIPIFCWISATVLQRLIKQRHSEIPKTLTEMYSNFLITQTNMKNQKYEENPERDPQNLLESNRTKLLKLAELAFKQLMKGNVMFYEEDLRESGIDVTEASVYSGVFTEIFREECVLYQRKVYCFVHLSFQEFLAGVYVFHCYESEKMEKLQCFIQLDDLLKKAVDKAVESQNGHLDLFLRFLLGISLESNQRLLQGLLTHTHTHTEKTTEYIKSIIKGDQISLSTERSINLFLCLSEMKDQSLSREILEYLKSEKHSEVKLSPGQCSALAYMLLASEEVLEELDLKKCNTSEEGYRRLIPAVTVCGRAVSGGGEPSCVSMKSDRSMDYPPGFSSGGREPSCVSMKSDRSMDYPPGFSSGGREPSCVSMKSDRSMDYPPGFSNGGGRPSYASAKSNSSGAAPSDSEKSSREAAPHTHTLLGGTGPPLQDSHQSVDDVLHRVIKRHKSSMKKKYESLFEGIKTEENKTLLNRIYTQLYIIEGETEGVNEEHEVLQMEKTPRRHREDTPINCLDIFKPLLDHKVPDLRSVLTKGIAGIGKTVSVQKFILDWAEGTANQDVDFMFVLPFRELNLIKDHQYSLHRLLCDFHPELKDLDPKIYEKIKAVLIFDGLDESRIPLNFEECEKVSDITMTSSMGVLMTNLIKAELLPSALIWITCRPAAAKQIPPKYINRVTEIQGFNDPQKEEYFRKRISDQDQAQKIISHIKTAKSLHIMCHIPVFCWISATVLQRLIKHHHSEIPKTLTEMYSHFLITQTNMKNQKYEEKDERDPHNLLEFNRTKLLKLAELAFKQLMKHNVMFYEEDLRESSIDVTEASVYSGVFTEIFREECVLYQRKVYCFVHLSFQEFLAAVYVFHCYESEKMEELQCFIPQYSEWSENGPMVVYLNGEHYAYGSSDDEWFFDSSDHEGSEDNSNIWIHHKASSENVPLHVLLIGAVNKAVESQNGHLDLFLRFLLGISLESNQRLLQGLLTDTHTHSEKTTSRAREYIKNLIKGDDPEHHRSLSTERAINLFLCLSEMKDQSLSREIQEYLNSETRSEVKLSPGQCSALAYMLQTSEEVLEELDLKKYSTSEEGYRRLIPAVTVCRKAVLAQCSLTRNSCGNLGSALQSENSSLKELDLGHNDLQDSGVELLSAGLKSPHCKLETLRLAQCSLTRNSCGNLRSALQSENSSLKELDLSNNDLQDLGVELLSAGLRSSHCKLEILRLAQCSLTRNSCGNLGSVLQTVNSSLKELDLSNNDLQDSGVELLSAGLRSSHCKLETLRLSGCMVTKDGCSFLASALKSNPSHLKELDLTYNHPGESGVKLLSDLLEYPHYKLENLLLEHGGEIRMKPGLKKYACRLTLDPNTAYTRLSLSEGNRKVEGVKEDQPYPDHPDRFESPQVLSVESLTGRCYWETECSGQWAEVAVSYRGIKRKGDCKDSWFGSNDQSWSLEFDGKYFVFHNNTRMCESPFSHQPGRVGVYLDWPAGTLSFYSILPATQTRIHILTHYTTFTEPLYAGFRTGYDSSVCVCDRIASTQDLD